MIGGPAAVCIPAGICISTEGNNVYYELEGNGEKCIKKAAGNP